MPDNLIQIEFNPPDLLHRMRRYPKKLDDELEEAMEAALHQVHAKVKAYPIYESDYERQNILGKSLGSDMHTGGRVSDSGANLIKRHRRLGQGKYEGRFGTSLEYAQYVIGTKTQAGHMSHWWTMDEIKERAEPGIKKIFEEMTRRLVKFLGG